MVINLRLGLDRLATVPALGADANGVNGAQLDEETKADRVLVYDSDEAAMRNVTETTVQGIESVATMREMGARADVVVTMLPDSAHVERCYLGPDGFCFSSPSSSSSRIAQDDERDNHGEMEEEGPGRLLIDCSTMDPARSARLAQHCARNGIGTFLDAPVSGGVAGAKQATLSFMVGDTADSPVAQRVAGVLGLMGGTIHHCGDRGAGLVAKLVNNYLLALNNLATAEAMRMGTALGIQAAVLGRVVNSSTGKCWPSEKNNPVRGITPGAPVERDFSGGFGLELMIKDLGLAIAAAEGAGVTLPSAKAAMAMYETVRTADNGKYRGKDFGVVYRYLEDAVRN